MAFMKFFFLPERL